MVGGGGAEGATAHATAGAAARSPGSGGTGPAKPAGHSSRASAGDVGNATSSKGTSAVEAAAAAVLDLPGASAGALAGGEPQVNGGEGAVAGGSAATAADNGTAAAAAPDPAATTAPPSAVTVDTSTRPAKPEGGRPRPSSGAAKERGRADASTLAPANRGTAAARPQSGRRAETGASPRQRPVPHAVKRARARARNITTTSVDLLGDVDTQAGAQQSQETRAVLVAAFKVRPPAGRERGGAPRRGPLRPVTLPSPPQHHFLFASLNEEDLSKAVAAMVREEYEAGRTIIQQNEPGSKFYVLEQGGCEVIVNEEKVADLEPGKGFGELALMYDSPRAATIRATKAAVAWSLDRCVT